MGINRDQAFGRMQASLMAWRRVAACRVRRVQIDRMRDAGMSVSYSASEVTPADADMEAIADGFDLMAALWSELEEMRMEPFDQEPKPKFWECRLVRRLEDGSMAAEDYAYPTWEELKSDFRGKDFTGMALTIWPVFHVMTIPNPTGKEFG